MKWINNGLEYLFSKFYYITLVVFEMFVMKSVISKFQIEKDYFSNQVTLDKLQRLYMESDERAETANVQVRF